MHIAIVGFGEVGTIFARELCARGARVTIYDILFDVDAARAGIEHRAAQIGVTPCRDLASAIAGARVVISAVTATSSLEVATLAAHGLRVGQFFMDLNSVSPSTKKASCERIEAAGGDYIEAAVMASVASHGIAVPMILGGRRAAELARTLEPMGMRLQVGTEGVGVASAVKMCRSIMMKGLEALAVECLLTARYYGVEEQVLASLDETYPQMHWQEHGDYLVSRVVAHGRRRAAEMREVARTVEEAGLKPLLAAPTAARHDWMADRVDEGTVARGEKGWRVVADAILQKQR